MRSISFVPKNAFGAELTPFSRFGCDSFNSSLRGICCVDLDRTLTLKTLAPRFGKWLCWHGELPHLFLWKASILWCFYRLGHLSFEILINSIANHIFKKKTVKELFDLAEIFSQSLLPRVFNAKTVAFIEQMRSTHLLVLTSRSPDFLVAAIAKSMNFDIWQASHWCLQKARYLTIDGTRKAELLDSLLASLQLRRDRSIALSDSYIDLPLLQMAGRAIAVHPDRALRHHALQAKWEIWN